MATKVLLEIQVKADDLAASYAGVHATLVETRKFPGAVQIEVIADVEDPSKLVVVETWETPEAHDAYTTWRATADGAPKELIAVLAGAPVTRIFQTRPAL
jgi:quinol monooxygenase YgiN